MSNEKIRSRITELLQVINSINPPEEGKKQLLQTTIRVKKPLQREMNLDTIEDSLSLLMVTVKYLVFDVEATHRQNNYLRKLIKDLKKKSRQK